MKFILYISIALFICSCNTTTKGKVMELTSENFNETISNNKVVLVDFWAEWCGPCKTVGPIIDQVAEAFAEVDGVVVGKVNVDSEGDLSNQYGIRSIPTILIFKNGEVVNKLVGAQQKQNYIDAINVALGDSFEEGDEF